MSWHGKKLPWPLWEHQANGVDRFCNILFEKRSAKRLVAYCPTGGGKTIFALAMILEALQRNMRCMFMAPRYELLDQVYKKLDQFAPFGYGKITADRKVPRSTYAELQVASLDTLVSRMVKRQTLILPPTHFVVMDECHLYGTLLRTELLKLFDPETIFIGLSATPGRHDGGGLNCIFEHIIKLASVRELTEKGIMAPGRYYSPSKIDMSKLKLVKTKDGKEYSKKQIGERMQPLLGDIPGHWMQLGPERRTTVFAHNVGQSVYLTDCFQRLGVAAEHVDGSMDPGLRNEIFERHRTGETQVLCNCDLATYGYDLPEMSHIVVATKTASVIRWLQMCGRPARAAKGKVDFIVQDHAGNWHEHGRHDEERFWTLDGFDPRKPKSRKAGQRAKNITQLECPECHCVFYGTLTCPDCGYFFEAAAKRFQVIEGELQEIGKDAVAEKAEVSELERREFYAHVLGYLEEHNKAKPEKPWARGWADYCYRARFKDFPPQEWKYTMPINPSIASRRWIKHYLIRKAKQWKKSQQQAA